jgi:uncharacterized membrane protein YfcA
MELGLAILGVLVGALSGFFGIGGGTILVPLLLLLGFDIKTAIGISIVQMVFSSIFGSYINKKKGTLDVPMVLTIGIGGFVGALFSSVVVTNFSEETLEWVFLAFVLFALSRLFFETKEHRDQREVHKVLLFVIGVVVGGFSVSIGVGGSLLLTPILVGFLHVPLKKAIASGLFFVVFSSLSGLISLSIGGHIDFYNGVLIGMASLLGVYGGIWLKHQTSDVLQKKLLLVFYLGVASYLTYRLVILNG